MSAHPIPAKLSFWEDAINMLFPRAGNPPQEQGKPSPPGKKEVEQEQQQQISALRHAAMAREIYG